LRRRCLLLLPLLLAALALTGCRLDVAADLTIARDGSATAELELRIDPTALTELDALGVDPTAELAAVAAQAPAWEVDRLAEEDGTLAVTLRREAADAATAAEAFRELGAGLVDADPGLIVDLEVDVDGAGAVRLEGTVLLRPPAGVGVTLDGEPLGPGVEELERLTADVVRARFSVTVPGEVQEHDADTVEGRTATWELEPGTPRSVVAVAAAPGRVPPWLVAAGVAVGVAALVLGVVLAASRWRRRRATSGVSAAR
jgi:hypothetical protein